MEFLQNLTLGFTVALGWEGLLYCLIGVTFGMFIGVLPGIGAISAISMLLPLTFHLDPAPAIILLAGFYYGSQYGGSISSILLNLPGGPSSAVTCLEGHPMAMRGRAGVALFMTTVASFVGGTFAFLLMAVLAVPLASMAVKFGAPEYTALLAMSLVFSSTLLGGSIIKSLAMVALGILLGLVGIDNSTAELRYTFGLFDLYDGLSLAAIAMGLLGIPEIVLKLSNRERATTIRPDTSLRGMMPERREVRDSVFPIARGSVVGGLIGMLPGSAPSISSFMSYALERLVGRPPQTFGTGRIEGLVAPEAANNASAQAAFIPTMTLGVPGDPMMALVMGALLIHGVTPGPRLVAQHPELFWGLVASFWVGNLMLLLLNIPLIGIWVRILKIPSDILFPLTLIFVSVGVYSIRNSPFDVYVLMGASILGCLLTYLRFSAIPLLLGLVLGPMLEQNLRQALMLSNGDPAIFLQRPISLGFLVVGILCVFATALVAVLRRRQRSQIVAADGRAAD